VSCPMNIGAKDYPSAIRSKAYVGLEAIVVLREIHELFNDERASSRCEQKYPLPVSRRGNALRTTAIAGEQLAVGGCVVMNRPVLTLNLVPGEPAACDVVTSEPEHLRLRRLQVIPDRLAVRAEKLVAPDFHLHS